MRMRVQRRGAVWLWFREMPICFFVDSWEAGRVGQGVGGMALVGPAGSGNHDVVGWPEAEAAMEVICPWECSATAALVLRVLTLRD